MSISNTATRSIADPVRATALSLGLALLGLPASNAIANDHTYEWSAKLVSFDRETSTAVVQARVELYADIDGLEEFADGDRLILSWTGRSWAAGIRGLAPDPELVPGTLALPVEFVSTEGEGRYVNFRIRVPESSVETLAAMEPGTRVTGVSPKTLGSRDAAIGELRHYNDVN